MLKAGIEQHIAESEQQVANLEQVFQLLGEKAKGEPCDAAKGIVTEGQMNLKEVEALLRQNLRQEEQMATRLEQNAPKLLQQAVQAEA